eukprot:m.67932 g.67932  ORF g.67932 m.67932 type:complete len:805 (+) comp11922_c0_seq1:234-2648(+)
MAKLLVAIFVFSLQSDPSYMILPAWKNHSLPIATRVEDLMNRLTLDELISQLGNSAGPFLDQPRYEYGQECLAGFQSGGMFCAQANKSRQTDIATSSFPHAVSLGMSFDPSLVRSVAAAIGYEARAGYTHFNRPSLTCLSPVLNVARDPRWGRNMESYGEDPLVISKLGAAYVTGMQRGDTDSPQTDILLMNSAPKHFADYNLECSCDGRNVTACNPEAPYPNCRRPNGYCRVFYDATVSAHDMRETYLPGWKAAAAADATGAMCSLNAVNGIPLCMHDELQNKILKEEFNFTGWMVSDANGVANIYLQPGSWPENPTGQPPGHNYTHTYPSAAADGLNGGCDISFECPDVISIGAGYVNGTLRKALAQGLTTEGTIREAARRTFVARFRTGLYDPPGTNPWQKIPASVIQSEEHTQLAIRAARETATLLKNNNKALPFNPQDDSARHIAVIGSASNSSRLQIDRYSGKPDALHISTFVEGISARAHIGGDKVITCTDTNNPEACAKEIKSQSITDIIIVATGHAEGESHDRAVIGLSDEDKGLLEAVMKSKTGVKKIVLVIVSGGPVATEDVEQLVDATVWTGKGGMQAGAGFAQLLYGDFEFSGRLSTTVYKSAWVNVSTFSDNYISGGPQPRGYRYMKNDDLVLYPFGFGLSYFAYRTQFSKTTYTVTAASLGSGATIKIDLSLSCTQTEARPTSNGQRTVLLYLSDASLDTTDSIELPQRVKWLAAFTKVHNITCSKTGYTEMETSVSLTLDKHAVSRWIPSDFGKNSFVDGNYKILPGTYSLTVSDGDDSMEQATLIVT